MKPQYTITEDGLSLIIEIKKPNYTLNQYQMQTIRIPITSALDVMQALNQYFNEKLQNTSAGEYYEN